MTPNVDVDALIARLKKARRHGLPQLDEDKLYGEAAAALAAQAQRIAELERENGAYKKEHALLTHKLITCGVAASHPDRTLSLRGKDYAKWDSPQAQEVRKLRDRAEKAEAALRQAVPREIVVAFIHAMENRSNRADGLTRYIAADAALRKACRDAAPAAPREGT